jgi:KUP system potassium uptake protein
MTTSGLAENAPLRKLRLGLAVGALGVVYGDIGTSPLYTLRECFNVYSIEPSNANVLGILSLIFWTILIIVTLKYVWIVMRADNHGEGGTLALLALLLDSAWASSRSLWLLVACGMLGAAMFYGDGIITPAISVLSAVEGLEVATPVFKPYIIPITVAILVLLFAVQRRGTASVGAFFGPVMGIWFATLAVLGAWQISGHPGVIAAVNPIHALEFAARHGQGTFMTLGAVVLAVTGAEALYADMGHFGAAPIRAAWLSFVWPALILNYFGQGALLLSDPATLKNPFFMMVPAWGLYPMVLLAAVATVIASQAVISGAFSVTQQALQLGFIPRLEIIHTSAQARGQIYLPWINWFLCISVIGVVLGFKSSSNLAAAYGIAVTGTMLTTTLLLYFLARRVWRWSAASAGALIGFFFVVDVAFFAANTLKIVDGGWFPLVVAAALFTLMSTWNRGRALLYQRLYPEELPLDQFISLLSPDSPLRVPGTAVYLTARGEGTPHGLLHNLKHYKVLHQRVVVLTILTENIPRVPEAERLTLKELEGNFYRLTARSGFMEIPDVPRLLDDCKRLGFEWDEMETSFFLNRQRVIPTAGDGMALWREQLYAAMVRNAANATDFFQLPPNRVVELGSRVEI